MDTRLDYRNGYQPLEAYVDGRKWWDVMNDPELLDKLRAEFPLDADNPSHL